MARASAGLSPAARAALVWYELPSACSRVHAAVVFVSHHDTPYALNDVASPDCKNRSFRLCHACHQQQ